MFLRSCAHAADIKAAAGFSHRYEKELINDPVTICDAVAGDPVRVPVSGLDMLITSPGKVVLLLLRYESSVFSREIFKTWQKGKTRLKESLDGGVINNFKLVIYS